MSLYYVKRVRIPRGPERLRGLYAGARPSYFHSACPTIPVTQLPSQIPGGNGDPLVAGPSSAASGGSVPLPCPFPEGNTESSTVTSVPCTPPTEIPRPGGTVECTAEMSSFPSSSWPSLPSVQASSHLHPFASIRGCSSDGNTQKTQPKNTTQTLVFIAQNTVTQTNPNTPKQSKNLNSKMSFLTSSSFSLFPLLPPVNIPLFDSSHLALIGGFSPDRTTENGPKKVYSRCIVGAVQKSGKSPRKLRKDTVPNTLKSPVFIAQNTPSRKNPPLAIPSVLPYRTKPHHPHPLRTETSCAEASNSEQLPSPFSVASVSSC
jgi:hypothetical protein